MLAVDFFTVETIWLQRLDVLFFIELGRPRVADVGRPLLILAGYTVVTLALAIRQHRKRSA